MPALTADRIVAGPFPAFVLDLVREPKHGSNTGKRGRHCAGESPLDLIGRMTSGFAMFGGFPSLVRTVAKSTFGRILGIDYGAVSDINCSLLGNQGEYRV